MFPPANDLIALLGINLVLCAGCLRLLSWRHGVTPWGKWASAAVFVLLWCPVGPARLPLVAYVRGISSDLSISLVAIACLGMYQRLRGMAPVAQRERMALSFAFAACALFLYPLALGWGDWDAYRLGWGSPALWAALLALSLACWAGGLRLLPALVALGLLAWVAGALESTNLWDYLIDPWLAVAAIFQCIKFAVGWGLARLRGVRHGAMPSSA
ncbi:hypothetical protein PMI15_04243 [Polaromonas sp. CF318]|uniref:hypothetical protein n=1 Tax=Polaromonas sp. CF318 TaxID=1144318 RepID=UPI000270EB12|nr:hypothetical protein [Polaromonas sp. CF318]EJL78650.1 hypothetical protein PMI15_04243 [Polaromonas sp. CF318]